MKGFLTLRRICAIRELVSLGCDAVDIAILFDREVSYITRLMYDGGYAVARPKRESDMRRSLRKLRSQGLTYRQISERIGTSPDVLKTTACVMGLSRRRRPVQ